MLFRSKLIAAGLIITCMTCAIALGQAHPEGNPETPTCWEGSPTDPGANGADQFTYDPVTGQLNQYSGDVFTYDRDGAHQWVCSPSGDARWHQIEHLHNSAWVVADATDDTNCYRHQPSPQAPSPLPSAWHLLFGDGSGNWCTRRLQQDWPTTQP